MITDSTYELMGIGEQATLPDLQAWRKDLEARGLSAARIRRKLSALSALFDYLCERNAISGNPVDGVNGHGEWQ